MIKTINTSIIVVIVTVLSCQVDKDRAAENNHITEGPSSHLGAWEMIYFQSILGNDTTIIISDGTPLAITLLTPAHFSYQWRNSPNSGAGTYTYDGKIIHQEFKYVQDSNFAGAILSFNMDVRNDSLIFSGPVKAVSSSGQDILNHIPQMLEIRRKSE